MTDEQKALVEWLRGHSKIMARDKGKFVRFIDVATCNEAADLIEVQAAENARLREALGFYANLPCRLEFGVVNECPYDDGDTARAALTQETQT
jgi:hypothetical protein